MATPKTIRAWCLYDWANSAFATTIMAAMFPPFYRSVVIQAGLAENTATAYWGYTTSLALLMVALMGPILGAIADTTGGKKRYLGFFAGLGILFTAAFVFIGRDTWELASLLFIGANVGFAGSIIFYESLLPLLAGEKEIDGISSRGYALGYLGGGLLLILNVLWVMHPETFGMPDDKFALKASFLSVAVWWGLFSVPLFRDVPEPVTSHTGHQNGRVIASGFRRLLSTLREITRHRQLFIFLIAFWVYNDGIGTIIKMATAYGDEIGIGLTDMVMALIITQFVGVPFTLLFARLAKRISAKHALMVGLGVYVIICLAGYFMRTAAHFYALAFMVGTVQGGCQALSRSIYGAMVPRHQSAEFFGFYSTSGKFAGILGPLLFGVLSQAVGHSRWSILALVSFFVVGMILLSKVDIEAGKSAARAAERVDKDPANLS